MTFRTDCDVLTAASDEEAMRRRARSRPRARRAIRRNGGRGAAAPVSRLRAAALAALLAGAHAAQAQAPAISGIEHYTENRGWNEAGLGPVHQIVLGATVEPSGLPTLVFAEQDGAREPMTHFATTGAPHLYAYWRRYDPAAAGARRVSAERGEARAAPAEAPAIARPQQVPLALDVRVAGKGATPLVRWRLPDLAGFDVERIRVAVRGGPRVQGRFLGVLYQSEALPAGATSFRIPAGVLAPGERYVFQVALEDLEDGRLENRSLAFSAPYAVPRDAQARPAPR
jgi:hypothetical protein